MFLQASGLRHGAGPSALRYCRSSEEGTHGCSSLSWKGECSPAFPPEEGLSALPRAEARRADQDVRPIRFPSGALIYLEYNVAESSLRRVKVWDCQDFDPRQGCGRDSGFIGAGGGSSNWHL